MNRLAFQLPVVSTEEAEEADRIVAESGDIARVRDHGGECPVVFGQIECGREAPADCRGFIDDEDSSTTIWPECTGDPASCPENEGFGCCMANPSRRHDDLDPGKAVAVAVAIYATVLGMSLVATVIFSLAVGLGWVVVP